jgi:hypothetical protein
VFVSDLRFQADAAKLLSIMLVLSACAAMFLVPAWVDIFKPKFIMEARAAGPADSGPTESRAGSTSRTNAEAA